MYLLQFSGDLRGEHLYRLLELGIRVVGDVSGDCATRKLYGIVRLESGLVPGAGSRVYLSDGERQGAPSENS